jgi:hypothetical protein
MRPMTFAMAFGMLRRLCARNRCSATRAPPPWRSRRTKAQSRIRAHRVLLTSRWLGSMGFDLAVTNKNPLLEGNAGVLAQVWCNPEGPRPRKALDAVIYGHWDRGAVTSPPATAGS